MKAFFADIFEYHHHINQQVIDLFIANQQKISERSIPLLSHCINAHQIWNERILQIPNSLDRFDIHPLDKLRAMDEKNYDDTLGILQDFDLNDTIVYKNSNGDLFESSGQVILFHVANHFTHHRGQLMSELRSSGITPLMTDYIFYKR